MVTATPMFITDAALGRLATWLRLLGHDTVYAAQASDSDLVRRARAEARILLTRNTRLLRRRDLPPHVFVHDDDFRAQLRQVVHDCGLRVEVPALVRCVRCNTLLDRIAHAEACAHIPVYVCDTQASFARCPSCHRIYWPATHVERMRRELARMGLMPVAG